MLVAIVTCVILVNRLEKVHISRIDGLAKIVGTVANVSGATIITLYKCPPITHLWQPNLEFTSNYFKVFQDNDLFAKTENWRLECIYLLIVWCGQ